MTIELQIDLGENELDQQVFIGFMAVSSDAPKDFQSAEVVDGELHVQLGSVPEDGPMQELLRCLGGAAKGEDVMRVLAPQELEGLEVAPAEASGPRRYPCPRCSRTVIEGKNQEPGMDICKECAAVDRKLAGGAPPAAEPAPSSARPAVQVPGNLRAQMGAAPEEVPPVESEEAKLERSLAQTAGTGLVVFPCVRYVADLKHPPPRPGIAVLVLDGERLAVSTPTGWRVFDGTYPPV